MPVQKRRARVPQSVRVSNAARQAAKPSKPWDEETRAYKLAVKAAHTIVGSKLGQGQTLLSIQARLTAFCEVAADIIKVAPDHLSFERAVRAALSEVGRPDVGTNMYRWEHAIAEAVQADLHRQRMKRYLDE